MKLVVNNCYGRFGLSPKAQERYWGLKGKQVFFYVREYGTKKARKASADANPLLVEALFKDYGPLVNLAEVPREEFARSETIERHDPVLVRVVEEMGKVADGWRARLTVIEIPDGADYIIRDYNGKECVWLRCLVKQGGAGK